MLYRTLIALAFIIAPLLFSCGKLDSSASTAGHPAPTATPVQFDPTPTPTPDQGPPQTGTVNFKGVSITSAIPGVAAVQPTVEPAFARQEPTDKPDNVAPEHISFKFTGPYPESVGESYYGQPEIDIYPVAKFPEVWAVSEEGVKSIQAQLDLLRNILKVKSGELKNVPYIRFVDGTAVAISHVSYPSFKNGSGVLYLAPFSMELDFLRDRSLTYIFQGFTSDGKYYIFGSFPVSSKVLPQDENELKEYEGYKLKDFFGKDGRETGQYRKYIAYIKAKLESQKAGDFTPALDTIEKTISSLEVNR